MIVSWSQGEFSQSKDLNFFDKYILVKDRWCEKIDFSMETKEHELNSHWFHYVEIHADLWDQWIVHYTWEIKRKKGTMKYRPGGEAQWVRVFLFQSLRTWVWIPSVHGKSWAWICITCNFSTAGNKDMRVTGACWLPVQVHAQWESLSRRSKSKSDGLGHPLFSMWYMHLSTLTNTNQHGGYL